MGCERIRRGWGVLGLSLVASAGCYTSPGAGGASPTGWGSDGADGPAEGSASGSATGGAEPSADSSDGGSAPTGEDSEPPVDSCPEPPVPPSIVNADRWCPEGFAYDEAYRLCTRPTVARGPFTDAMIEACEACGAAACGDEDWPPRLARGIRGTGACPPGTSASEEGLCVDPQYAWGPFTEAMVEACIASDGGDACRSMRWDRDLAESVASLAGPWRYIMDLDYGIREDGFGLGHFGASRSGNPGGHSGIDFLAPVGTPLLAPCDGPVQSGYASGYGNYVQLACPIPDQIAQGNSLYGSLFYAHMDTLLVSNGDSVVAGDQVGTVGKSGNASAAGLNAHVHFEIVIHASEGAALGESHASANHSSNPAADLFASLIAERCWTPQGFDSLTGPSMKGRRPDPFMLLSCLVGDKPALTEPPASLQGYLEPWSSHYEADGFDVDR